MSNAADLRAMALAVMLEHASIQPRGFDSIARRQRLQCELDDLLDDYALEVLAEPEPVS